MHQKMDQHLTLFSSNKSRSFLSEPPLPSVHGNMCSWIKELCFFLDSGRLFNYLKSEHPPKSWNSFSWVNGLSGFYDDNVFSGTSVTGPRICVQLCPQMQNSGGGGSVAIKAEVNFEALCIFRRGTKRRPRGWCWANHAHTKTHPL